MFRGFTVAGRLIPILLVVAILLSGCGPGQSDLSRTKQTPGGPDGLLSELPKGTVGPGPETVPDEKGSYTSLEDVSRYLLAHGRLPGNFITKAEARKLGWTGGDLRPYAPGACIGGDRFGNYEGLLPDRKGRVWFECDIGTLGKGSRGAKRLVYSNDGLIYYTEDHYASFVRISGGEP